MSVRIAALLLFVTMIPLVYNYSELGGKWSHYSLLVPSLLLYEVGRDALVLFSAYTVSDYHNHHAYSFNE